MRKGFFVWYFVLQILCTVLEVILTLNHSCMSVFTCSKQSVYSSRGYKLQAFYGLKRPTRSIRLRLLSTLHICLLFTCSRLLKSSCVSMSALYSALMFSLNAPCVQASVKLRNICTVNVNADFCSRGLMCNNKTWGKVGLLEKPKLFR